MHLHRESGDIELPTAEKQMNEMRSSIQSMGYKVENIFNMDETGLFYRAIPNHTYLMSSENDKQQAGHGLKAMKAKDRITIILYTNSTGTCKVPPTVIGAAKKVFQG